MIPTSNVCTLTSVSYMRMTRSEQATATRALSVWRHSRVTALPQLMLPFNRCFEKSQTYAQRDGCQDAADVRTCRSQMPIESALQPDNTAAGQHCARAHHGTARP